MIVGQVGSDSTTRAIDQIPFSFPQVSKKSSQEKISKSTKKVLKSWEKNLKNAVLRFWPSRTAGEDIARGTCSRVERARRILDHMKRQNFRSYVKSKKPTPAVQADERNCEEYALTFSQRLNRKWPIFFDRKSFSSVIYYMCLLQREISFNTLQNWQLSLTARKRFRRNWFTLQWIWFSHPHSTPRPQTTIREFCVAE